MSAILYPGFLQMTCESFTLLFQRQIFPPAAAVPLSQCASRATSSCSLDCVAELFSDSRGPLMNILFPEVDRRVQVWCRAGALA